MRVTAAQVTFQEGREEGWREALDRVLAARFPNLPPTVREAIQSIQEIEMLQDLLSRAAVVSSLEDLGLATA